MKIRFESDDNLLLNKTVKFHNLAVIVRSVFQECSKYYTQVFFRWMFLWVIKLIKYEKNDISEGIDLNKTGASKEYMAWHYWHFKDIGYKFQPQVCNKCHDISMMVYDLNDFMILNIKDADYRCILWNVTRNAINSLHNYKLKDKRTLWIWILVIIKHLLK